STALALELARRMPHDAHVLVSLEARPVLWPPCMEQQIHPVDVPGGVAGFHGPFVPAVPPEAVARILLGAGGAVVEVPPVGHATGGVLCARRELDRERRGSCVDVRIGVGLELAVAADEEPFVRLPGRQG